jgi:hypothetical protein
MRRACERGGAVLKCPNPRRHRHDRSLPRQEKWLGRVTVAIWQSEALLGVLRWLVGSIRKDHNGRSTHCGCIAEVGCRSRLGRVALAVHMPLAAVENHWVGETRYSMMNRSPSHAEEVSSTCDLCSPTEVLSWSCSRRLSVILSLASRRMRI